VTAGEGPLQGQVCLITGATSGIGQATAHALARKGAAVVILGRNPEKGASTLAGIQQETGNPSIGFLLADLTDQGQVRRAAADFRERYARLDVLINNAGGFFWRRQESIDGIEMTLALNHLAPFLLTNLLLDVLEASAPARVINVSSDMHRSAQMDFDDLQMEHGYSGMKAYARSKLAMILFTYELARRLGRTHVTANAVHPGFVATNIGLTNAFLRLFRPVMRLFAKSPEEGAETSVYLAASPDVTSTTGAYFVYREKVRSSPATYDAAAAERLWEISTGLTGLRRSSSR
jgi:NAD(P)-dependent dehydrogenase (short-subunit alcohol dehydrogenase family)